MLVRILSFAFVVGASIAGAACSSTHEITPPDDSGQTGCLLESKMTPATANIAIGDTTRLTVAFGCASADTRATFSSSDTTVATVDAAGLVRARAVGQATITASRVVEPTDRAAALIRVTAPTP